MVGPSSIEMVWNNHCLFLPCCGQAFNSIVSRTRIPCRFEVACGPVCSRKGNIGGNTGQPGIGGVRPLPRRCEYRLAIGARQLRRHPESPGGGWSRGVKQLDMGDSLVLGRKTGPAPRQVGAEDAKAELKPAGSSVLPEQRRLGRPDYPRDPGSSHPPGCWRIRIAGGGSCRGHQNPIPIYTRNAV